MDDRQLRARPVRAARKKTKAKWRVLLSHILFLCNCEYCVTN